MLIRGRWRSRVTSSVTQGAAEESEPALVEDQLNSPGCEMIEADAARRGRGQAGNQAAKSFQQAPAQGASGAVELQEGGAQLGVPLGQLGLQLLETPPGRLFLRG